jgi:hypothetical protein|tara:strand:- start:11240 stop:11551 length:312 start_codon:yes stop_codon:yes gene_type:complete
MIFWTVFIVDVLLIFTAYVVNKNNAKYLMAGYNTMSVEERKKVDLENLLIFWKKFFVILAFASTLIFIISYLIFSEAVTAVIWSVCLIIPWPIFIYKLQKFVK